MSRMAIFENINSLKPKSLFLIDFIGALVSAIFLGLVLPRFQSYLGIPLSTLYILAVIPIFFFIYSLFGYFKISDKWKPYLKGIAIANTLYCCLTFCLLIYHKNEVTWLAIIYFITEIIIVLSLSFVEYKRANSKA